MATYPIIAAYFDSLTEHRLCFSFFLEPVKSILVVLEGCKEAAARFFVAYQFEIVTGTRYLIGFVGSKDQEKTGWMIRWGREIATSPD